MALLMLGKKPLTFSQHLPYVSVHFQLQIHPHHIYKTASLKSHSLKGSLWNQKCVFYGLTPKGFSFRALVHFVKSGGC